VWQAQNGESTGELLIDFFRYFANTFDYTKSVISIRSEKGTLGKEEKGWNSDVSSTLFSRSVPHARERELTLIFARTDRIRSGNDC